RQLFYADGKRERIHARPAVFAGDQDTHEARFGRGLDRLGGETVVAIDLGGERPHDALSELPNGVAKARVLGRTFEVQVQRYLEEWAWQWMQGRGNSKA